MNELLRSAITFVIVLVNKVGKPFSQNFKTQNFSALLNLSGEPKNITHFICINVGHFDINSVGRY